LKKVQLECWEEFESEVSAIHKALEERRVEMQMHISSLLFRGHAQECWRLKTALERYSGRVFSLTDYYRIMLAVQPAVESLTSKCWNLPYVSKIDEEYYGPPPGYEFMIYLGHHGFPSPLLDWTRSSYVAAFFAFHPHPDKREGNVAIYSYIEHYGHGKGSFHSEGMIIGLGPSVRTHKRHFIQQSEYTICKKFDGERYVYY
jgi:hypothetical protein